MLDPTNEEEQRSSYSLSVWWNLLAPGQHRIHKHGTATIQPELLEKLVELSRTELSKQKFNIADLQQRLQNISSEGLTLELE